MGLFKRIVSTATAVAMAFGAVCVSDIPFADISLTAEAAGESLTLSSISGAPGETVTMDVIVECNNNFESLDIVINWDESTGLTAERAVSANGVSGASDAGDGYVTVVAYGSGPIADGTVATIDFTIPYDAEPYDVYDVYIGTVTTFAIFGGDDIADYVPTVSSNVEVVPTSTEPTEPDDSETTGRGIYVGNVSSFPGETVRVPINITCNNKFESMDITLIFDESLIAEPAVGANGVSVASDAGNGYVTIVAYGLDAISDGTIAYVDFTITDDELYKVYDITVSEVYTFTEFGGDDYYDSVSVSNGSIIATDTERCMGIYVGNVVGDAGETVKVPIDVTCSNNLEALDITLSFDSSLTAESAVSVNGVSSAYEAGDGYVTLVAYGFDAIADGVVAYVDFTIPEDAQFGDTYDIYVSEVKTFAEFGGDDYASSVPVYNGSISVGESEVYPPESGMGLYVGDVVGMPGETVTVPVSVTCNNNFESMDIILGFDPELTASKAVGANGASVASYAGEDYVTIVAYGSSAFSDCTIATVDFTIPEDAEYGTIYDVYVSEVTTFAEFGGDDYASSVPVYNGSISVGDVTVYPPESGMGLYVGDVVGMPGETVTVPVSVTCNNNFESMDIILGFDPELTASEAVFNGSNGVSGASDAGESYVTLVAYGSGAIADGVVAYVDFTIPEDAEYGTIYDVYVSEVKTFAEFGGDDYYDTVPVYNGTITIETEEELPTTTVVTTSPTTTTTTTSVTTEVVSVTSVTSLTTTNWEPISVTTSKTTIVTDDSSEGTKGTTTKINIEVTPVTSSDVMTNVNPTTTTTTKPTTSVTTTTKPTTSVTTTTTKPTTSVTTTTFTKGDVNRNGDIDLYDAIEIAKYLIKARTFTEEDIKIADISGNGEADLYDAIAIAKELLKKTK